MLSARVSAPLAERGLIRRFMVVGAVPVVAMLALAVITLRALAVTSAATNTIVIEITKESDTVAAVNTAVLETDRAFYIWLSGPTSASRRELLLAAGKVDNAFKRATRTEFGRGSERRYLLSAAESWRKARAAVTEVARSQDSGRPPQAATARYLYGKNSRSTLASLRQAHERIDDEVGELRVKAKAETRQAQLATVVTGVIGLTWTLLAVVALAYWLLIPVTELTAAVARLAAGDMSSRVKTRGPDELGELADSFNSMAGALKEHTEELETSSIHDFLTGVFNRREFHWRVDEEVERCRRYGREFTLVILDVDFLKAINDGLGHLAGDKALCAIADTLVRLSRPSDLIARYGGDEFVILMPETGDKAALAAAERIVDTVKSLTVKGDSASVRLSISAGIASFPKAAVDKDELFAAADKALYLAKQSGRARSRIYESEAA